MNVIVHSHIDNTPDELHAMPEKQAARLLASVEQAAPAKCSCDAWVAVPPAGSEWEAAEWDSLARRAGA